MAENNLDPQGDHNIGNDSSGAQQRTVQIDGIAATDTNSLNMGLRDSQGSSSVQTDRTLVSSIPSENSNRTQQITLHTDDVSASDNNVVHMTVHNSQVRPSLQTDGIAMSPFQVQSGEGSRLRTVQTDGISGSNSIGLGLRQRHVEALLQPEDIDEEEMNLDERQWHIEPPPSSLEDVSTSGSDSNVVTSEPRVSTNIPLASASNSANGLLENGATRDPGPLASATSGSSPPSSMFNSLSRLFFTDPQATKSPAAPLECPHKSKGCKAPVFSNEERLKFHEEDSCSFRRVKCPSHHRSSCNWTGWWHKELFHHIHKNDKCVQTIRPLAENSHFRSNIIDFEGDRNSVFLKARNSNWLPMVLVFKVDGIYECMYLVVSRVSSGTWYLIPRTYAPLKILSRLRVGLQVHQPSSAEEQARAAENARNNRPEKMGPKDPCFRYEGPLNRHSDSDEKVMAGGKYLMVDDDQIKPLMQGRSLFEYAVEINVAPKTQ